MSSLCSSDPGSRRGPALAAFALLVALGAAVATAEEDRPTLLTGPFALRVQNPLFLLFPRLLASPVEMPAAGRGEVTFTSAYTSFFRIDERGEADLVVLDGELWRNTLGVRLGLGSGLALWCEVPTLHGGSGFLDHFVEEYHDFFGFDQEGRDENPDDQFAFLLINEGRLAYRLPEDTLGLGDVTLGVDWQVPMEHARTSTLVLRAAVELPTGDEARGFGSGGLDGALGATVHRAYGRYLLSAQIAYQLLETPAAFERAKVRAENNWVADVALERRLGSRLAALLQVGYEQSPVRGAPLAASNDSSGTLTVGLGWRPASRWLLEIAFQEDFDGETTQDFTAQIALRREF